MQSSAENRTLQKGVSVEMASANNAQAWPRADDNDAWVVTVDETGRLYFGTDPMTPEGLKQRMIRHSRSRDQKLYIKADARAPFASVEKALEAASAAEFAEPVLLVNQRDGSAAPGTVVAPKGLEVQLEAKQHDAIVVALEDSPSKSPTLRMNNEVIAWDSLQQHLQEFVQGRDDKSVLVEADGQATFAQVARVIDACQAAKAKVVLNAMTL
jgi:biopolymer transport protein ExbD